MVGTLSITYRLDWRKIPTKIPIEMVQKPSRMGLYRRLTFSIIFSILHHYIKDKMNKIKKYILKDFELNEKTQKSAGIGKKLLKRIMFSAIVSICLIALILYTLPLTVLTFPALIEYAIVISLVIFMLILLFRYFSILILAYLHLNEYTLSVYDNNYNPFVSIIVPVYNEGKIINSSIKSLLKLNYSNYEIIIVNDGSTDDTKEICQKLVGYHNGIKISLISKENGGKSNALNLGIQYSKADFILCMDGDSQLSPDTLKSAIRHFVNPDIGAVAGNVKVLNRGKFWTDLQALEYIEGLNMARSAQSYLRLVNIIPGPIGVFRKSALMDAGFYSSDTFAEDADLTLKIMATGWKIYYEMDAISYTQAPETIHQLIKQRYRWTRGILQAIRKHKKLLLNPTINIKKTIILWSMLYEALIWPSMNILSNLFFILAALFFGSSYLILFWVISLILLDLISALYCIAVEREEFRLMLYPIAYRMFFILMIDVCKFASMIEEFLGIEMSWGKLERKKIVTKVN